MTSLRIAAAGLLVACLAVAVRPAAAQAVWQGNFLVTQESKACGPEAPVGSLFLALYRPHIAPPPQGQKKESLSIIGPDYAIYYFPADTDTLQGVNRVEGLVIHPNAESSPLDEDLGLTITPARITATTHRVHFEGILQHFLNNHACDLHITGTLFRMVR